MSSPEIRFKGFNDEWEQYELGELCEITTGKLDANTSKTNGKYAFFTCGKETLKTDSYSFDGDSILVNGNGDLGYTRKYSGKFDAYQRTYVLQKFCTDYGFIEQAIHRYLPDKIDSESLGGAMPYIKQETLSKLIIPTPNDTEVKKVSDYLNSIDNIITLLKHKCKMLTIYKKALLDNMFPKDGEGIPKIRFNGFTNAWKEYNFGDLADYKKGPFGSAITKDMFVPQNQNTIKVYEQQNAINKNWKLERYFLPEEYVLSKLKSFEVHGGDIIISCAGTIGEIYELPQNAKPGIINQALMRVRVNEDVIDKNMFIISFSNMIDEFSKTHSGGSAIKNIPPFADLKAMNILLPSMIEQKKISNYFLYINNLIVFYKQKLDMLQDIKHALLQKMFV